MKSIQQKTIDTIRVISAEAITKAKSGHPGLPLGCAALGYTLFAEHMLFDGTKPNFVNRDRFVLSAGHGSMLQYMLLHLFGYNVTMDDIKSFRQLGSICAGHPERGVCDGVEISTGPLGQGLANAVGLAIAETILAKKFNKKGYPVVDHHTYTLLGDGCMMEGISYEAASFAGTNKLNKLIAIYDDNDISIEGNTDITFADDVAKRFVSANWNVLKVADGNNVDEISKAIAQAKQSKTKPTLIICKTHIGFGSPLVDSEKSHGAPLSAEQVEQTKQNLGWTNEPFTVSDDVYFHCKQLADEKRSKIYAYEQMFEEYCVKYPKLAKEFKKWLSTEELDLSKKAKKFKFDNVSKGTRNYSGEILNELAKIVPNLVGGSADLGPSNCTVLKGAGDYSAKNRAGRNFHFGVREQAMSAILNGMAAHGGLKVYGATFFVFSDYLKGMLRMSALMQLPVTYVLSHDSIGVGEDGPTHEPIEHLIALRATPDFVVFRPADLKETEFAWLWSIQKGKPSALVLSRQKLPAYDNKSKDLDKGAYIYSDCSGTPDLLLLATGSEVSVMVEAQKQLANVGIKARVISFLSMELFDQQSEDYKQKVLPSNVAKRISLEAGSTIGWYKYVGLQGKALGIDTFGASAPAEKLFALYGITAENVVATAHELLK